MAVSLSICDCALAAYLLKTFCVTDIVQKPVMKPWFSWIMWIDPLYYAVEGMLGNELKGRVFPCEGPNLIPTGPGYVGGPGSCAGVGGSIGTSVNGSDYLKFLRFSETTAWRNFGVIWAFWFLFIAGSKSYPLRLTHSVA